MIPTKLHAPVAYKYRCFNATYIGKTKRQLTVRIVEQNGQSIKTNITLTKPPYNAIREHALETDHTIHTLILSPLAQIRCSYPCWSLSCQPLRSIYKGTGK